MNAIASIALAVSALIGLVGAAFLIGCALMDIAAALMGDDEK